jgi:hypothetical protein
MSAAWQRIFWLPGSRRRNLSLIFDALFLPLSFAWGTHVLLPALKGCRRKNMLPIQGALWRCRIHAIYPQYSTFSAKINGSADKSTL